jgi:hypothetical protein
VTAFQRTGRPSGDANGPSGDRGRSARRRRGAAALAALGLVAVAGCASEAPPPGGPPDTTPPYVLAASPESLATGVDSTAAVSITFSEKIDRASARDWFFMNPYVPIRDVDWDGPTMRVRFQGTLPSSTTFEVFLGSGVRDRAGLPLSPRFTRLFSTGSALAEGVIEGRVLRGRKRPTPPGTAGSGPPPPQAPPTTPPPSSGGGAAGTTVQTSVPRDAIFVWLFPLAGDTLPDPLVETPVWVGEAGPDGRFALRGVPIHASYHLLALYDADRSKGPGSSRDYWTFHPDTLVLTAFRPAVADLEVELIDPKSPAEIAGRLAAPIDTTVADTLAYGVLAAPADTGGVGTTWPPLTGLQSARVAADGRFTLRSLKPGAWRLAAFRDNDGDGSWDTGEPLGPSREAALRPDDRIIDIELARPPGD